MENQVSANELVRVEIQAFLKALDSYPARFAIDPEVTFDEHRASLIHFPPAVRLAAPRNQARKS
jgi:hypothetical protein